jgi:hypothetical protein
MKTKTMLAALLICFAAALAPTLASGDAGSAVQVDLTQLGTDVTAVHNTLVTDASNVTTAAQAGDKSAIKSAITTLRSDASTLLPAVQADRKQLVTDLTAAHAANVTGLGTDVRVALQADRVAIREIRQAIHQARQAVRALRQASVSTQS